MSIIIKSNSLPHLHAAKGAGRWAFAPRDNHKDDLALLTFLQNHLQRNSGIIGYYTDSNNPPKNPDAGALLYGFLKMEKQDIRLTETKDVWWPGPYNMILDIDWHYIREDQSVVDKNTMRNILGRLNKGGHMPMKITPDGFFKLIQS